MQLLFLFTYSAFFGWCVRTHHNSLVRFLYLIFAILSGTLFWFLPIVYFAAGLLLMGLMIWMLGMSEIITENKDDALLVKANLIATSFFFWPMNVFDMVYGFINLVETKK